MSRLRGPPCIHDVHPLPLSSESDLMNTFSGYLSDNLFALALCFLTITWYLVQRRNASNPTQGSHCDNLRALPSPPSEPILGHLRSVPLNASWLTFAEWYKPYGEVVELRVMGRPMVILNSAISARALLEKKGANFSGRPPFHFFRYW